MRIQWFTDFLTSKKINASKLKSRFICSWKNILRLEDSMISDRIGCIFRRMSILMEPFNQKVIQFVEAGLTEKIVSNDRKHFNVEPPDVKVVLTLAHLAIGFYIWLGCIAISFMFFLFELCLTKLLSIVYVYIMRQVKAQIKWILMVEINNWVSNECCQQ